MDFLSPRTIRIIIAGALFLHGIAHGIALGALVAQSLRGPRDARVSVQTWLIRGLSARATAAVALPFWTIATVGFLAASLSVWGVLVSGDAWRQLALVGSIVSLLGIALFSGIWPGSPTPWRSILNTAVALAMNFAVLVTQLWLRWPPPGVL